MQTRAAIAIRHIPNDLLVEMQEQLAGLYIQTDFSDHRGRLVSGKLISAKRLDVTGIGVSVMRYLDGRDVADGALIPAGKFMDQPYRTAVHIPEDHPALTVIDSPAQVAA